MKEKLFNFHDDMIGLLGCLPVNTTLNKFSFKCIMTFYNHDFLFFLHSEEIRSSFISVACYYTGQCASYN